MFLLFLLNPGFPTIKKRRYCHMEVNGQVSPHNKWTKVFIPKRFVPYGVPLCQYETKSPNSHIFLEDLKK